MIHFWGPRDGSFNQGRALAELADHLGKLASRGDAAGRRAREGQARMGKGEDLGLGTPGCLQWSKVMGFKFLNGFIKDLINGFKDV